MDGAVVSADNASVSATFQGAQMAGAGALGFRVFSALSRWINAVSGRSVDAEPTGDNAACRVGGENRMRDLF